MKNKTIFKILFPILLLLFSSFVIYSFSFENTKKEKIKEIPIDTEVFEETKPDIKTLYNDCMNTPYLSNNTVIAFENLLEKYKYAKLSFYFEDVKNEYSYKMKEKNVYYGASVIKLLESVYLIEEAMKGNISLEDKVTYEQKHIHDSSLEMEKHSLGDKISLKDLITYMLTVSDNAAHDMVFDYIGVDNLKKYASSLGIKITANEKEHFGNLTALDGFLILKEAYKIIELNNEYSDLLKTTMDNEYYNTLNFGSVTFLHKYGLTEPYYHDIGIYLADSPYLISIFTTYAYEEYQTIIGKLSKEIYDIYETNLNEKNNYCTGIVKVLEEDF